MTGTICLKDLKVVCIVGVHAKERELPQPLLISIEMDVDFAEAVEGDNVSATVDYSDVAARLEELATDGQFQLIETLAEEAATMLFDVYDLVDAVRIEVQKPNAVPLAAYAAVVVERQRQR